MPTSRPAQARVGNLPAAVRMMNALDRAPVAPMDRVAYKRRLVADLCRMLDPQPAAPRHPGYDPADDSERAGGNGRPAPAAALSPRMHETLDRLLAGDSEKEIAARFRRSRNTVHVYVKKLYQRYGVSSRGELLALFVRTPLT